MAAKPIKTLELRYSVILVLKIAVEQLTHFLTRIEPGPGWLTSNCLLGVTLNHVCYYNASCAVYVSSNFYGGAFITSPASPSGASSQLN